MFYSSFFVEYSYVNESYTKKPQPIIVASITSVLTTINTILMSLAPYLKINKIY